MNARLPSRLLGAVTILLAVGLTLAARASDHADPMSINVLEALKTPEANITDLHAFIVDGQHQRITDPARLANVKDDDQLIISLCVRRSLPPQRIGQLKLEGYTFRLHLDYDAPVRILTDTDKNAYEKDLAAARDAAKQAADAVQTAEILAKEGAMAKATAADARVGDIMRRRQAAVMAQALYGGIITDAPAIAEEAVIDFELSLSGTKDEQATVAFTKVSVQGIQGSVNQLPFGTPDHPRQIIPASNFKPGEIFALAGVFDDPFIFPRFFRRNVVGIVTSIPLKALVKNGRHVDKPLLLWATTHKGKEQIDHVGRSLRTQLPRFGYLNDKHPSQQVEAIRKVHGQPNLIEGIEATFIAPLLAHRHYDDMPDVMIYDLAKPAVFPNGRWLEDDVSKTLADAGETILLELSHAESREFPRATRNDKPFRNGFPFLAPRWTEQQVNEYRIAGKVLDGYSVPQAADADTIATPDFNSSLWHSVWLGEVLIIGALILLCFILAHRNWLRLALIVISVLSWCYLKGLLQPKLMPLDSGYFTQPETKELIAIVGGLIIAALVLLLTWLLGRRSGVRSAVVTPASPAGAQEQVEKDLMYDGSTFNEVRDAVFKDPYYGAPWGADNAKKLPVHEVTFASVAKGLFSKLSTKRFPFGNAAARTIASHADLRWGSDGRGVKRLLHPNGIVLTGRWKINDGAPDHYTGGFKPGTDCLIIGRYSTCCTETRSGHYRSLSLVGKLYPTLDPNEKHRPKGFITQEDIGGNLTRSIFEGDTFNAPNVTPHRRWFPGIFPFLVTVITFVKTDREPAMRQLYEIAELGEDQEAIEDGRFKIKCPKFMRLSPVSPSGSHPEPPDKGTDFRDEIMAQLYNPGDPARKPNASLKFDIAISEAGEQTGLFYKKLRNTKWQTIGAIEFTEAVVSPNGDNVIHFHHPAWRTDVADPKSADGPKDKFIVRLLKKLIP